MKKEICIFVECNNLTAIEKHCLSCVLSCAMDVYFKMRGVPSERFNKEVKFYEN